MPPEYERLFKTPVQSRIIEKRTSTLDRLLKEAQLKTIQSIECKPMASCIQKRCFVNVDEIVAKHGGSLLTGWMFMEFKDRYITAIAHGIWLSDKGKKLDVTPHEFQPTRLLFAPDDRVASKRGYTAPSKLMLSDNPYLCSIERFESIIDNIFENIFSGFGKEIKLSGEVIQKAAHDSNLPLQVAEYLLACRTSS